MSYADNQAYQHNSTLIRQILARIEQHCPYQLKKSSSALDVKLDNALPARFKETLETLIQSERIHIKSTPYYSAQILQHIKNQLFDIIARLNVLAIRTAEAIKTKSARIEDATTLMGFWAVHTGINASLFTFSTFRANVSVQYEYLMLGGKPCFFSVPSIFRLDTQNFNNMIIDFSQTKKIYTLGDVITKAECYPTLHRLQSAKCYQYPIPSKLARVFSEALPDNVIQYVNATIKRIINDCIQSL